MDVVAQLFDANVEGTQLRDLCGFYGCAGKGVSMFHISKCVPGTRNIKEVFLRTGVCKLPWWLVFT